MAHKMVVRGHEAEGAYAVGDDLIVRNAEGAYIGRIERQNLSGNLTQYVAHVPGCKASGPVSRLDIAVEVAVALCHFAARQ